MQTVVERELELGLVLSPERSVEVPARLMYHAGDPYAVHVTFHIGTESPVRWTFSRELLVEGAVQACGQGDVRVWPSKAHGREVICIALSSPDGDALLQAPTVPVTTWLESTLRLVPPGREAEWLRIDERLEELFSAMDAGEPPYRNLRREKDTGPETSA